MKQASSEDYWQQCYDDLRAIARHILGGRQWTLQTTALVNEAYLKKQRSPRVSRFENRLHFLREMTLVLRSVLADEYDRRTAAKRDSRAKVPLDEWQAAYTPATFEALVAMEAWRRIKGKAPEGDLRLLAEHYIGCLSLAELAEIYECTRGAVKQRLYYARRRAREILTRAEEGSEGNMAV